MINQKRNPCTRNPLEPIWPAQPQLVVNQGSNTMIYQEVYPSYHLKSSLEQTRQHYTCFHLSYVLACIPLLFTVR